MTEDDVAYYRRRAAAAAEQSLQAASPEIARIHSQLADAYRERVMVASAGKPQRG